MHCVTELSTWSKPDLVLLVPGLVIGIGIGYFVFRVLDHRAIAILMAAITLAFVGLWLIRGAEVTAHPRSRPKAVAAGFTSGITTMVAHSGGPPLAMYLLPLGLTKEVYAGTTSLFFTVGNATKLLPWLLLSQPSIGTSVTAWGAGPAPGLSRLLPAAGRDRVEVAVGWHFRLRRLNYASRSVIGCPPLKKFRLEICPSDPILAGSHRTSAVPFDVATPFAEPGRLAGKLRKTR